MRRNNTDATTANAASLALPLLLREQGQGRRQDRRIRQEQPPTDGPNRIEIRAAITEMAAPNTKRIP